MHDTAHRVLDLLWLLPAGICAYGIKYLRELTLSVEMLNRNIAVILFRMDKHEDTLGDHEDRLRHVELS
jgi:hypothetical protein